MSQLQRRRRRRFGRADRGGCCGLCAHGGPCGREALRPPARAEPMADSYSYRGGKKIAGSSKNSTEKEGNKTELKINPAYEQSRLGNATNDKTESKKKGRPKADSQALKDIPLPLMNQWKDEFKAHSRVKCPNSGCWLEFPSIYGLKYHYQRCQGSAIVEKRTFPCPYCEAAFTSKTQLEKHRLWNHLDRPLPAAAPPLENKVQKAAGKAGGKKRAAEGSASSTVHPKQAKMEKAVALQRPENGECAPMNQGSRESQAKAAGGRVEAATPATQPSGGRSSKHHASRQAAVQEEDPERMKHKLGRKQKTPKKFTGEQPSISGTFGLKGLAKAEDKAKAHRAKKLEAALSSSSSNNEDLKKKLPGSSVKKEAALTSAAPSTTVSPEEQWQRTISEKGEVACPTCSMITRKTVLGLKKHMEVCQKLQDALKCQHCKKQFKSKAGLNYHTMAEHVNKPVPVEAAAPLNEHEERERLRKVLKQMGKLKCPNEGCIATFSSLMGYQYHQKRCGKQPSEVEKPVFSCPHCGKTYKSKAGHDYHVRSEHPSTPPEQPETKPEVSPVEDFERTPSGRIRRTSAQVAVFHLQEIAEDELAKDWTKRRMKDDLVPETKRLNYTRPGLPKLNPKLLETWKNEVKEKGHINCPNNCCAAIYSSVSGLKAHLANCNKGDHSVGKYQCLLCQKEFSSESGVKYHIIKTHSENWFQTSTEVIRKKKNQEQTAPSNEEKKQSTDGKKRGRKPKERPPEVSAKSKESTIGKTNHKKATGSWQTADCSPDGRERGSKALHSKKGGASKMPEK
ncbi:zinc finger protein 512B isoform X3 [Hemicordylus capensis]|uniref:zinc finger protein 512B isoform X3 n=1 Tax=Hemicordylus capensis TaxID=884348 RepID=UPI002303BD30|nr:zinc finger protein 512B isoform X3 [Hemicordylus capensis]